MFIFLFPLLIPAIWADSSCRTECHKDRMPQCGTWLISETKAGVSGTYQLGHGVVNMSCEFSSLPVPASVAWVHRQPNAGNWNDFACSNKEESKQCSQETEHHINSRCILRTTSLGLSGTYRCQATTPDVQSKAISSEVTINVVGIEKVRLIDANLPYGKSGFVEVEVCANPKPEIFWVSGPHIVRPHGEHGRFAATTVVALKIRSSEDGPGQLVPYCYVGRLFIAQVHRNDSISVVVRNEGETRTVPLPVQILNLPKTSPHLSLLSSLIICLSFLMTL